MRSTLIISTFVAVVYCRPEAPTGYPPSPSSRYGAPLGASGFSQGGFNGQSLGGAASAQFGAGGGFGAQSNLGGGGGNGLGASFGAQSNSGFSRNGGGFGGQSGIGQSGSARSFASASASSGGFSGRSFGGHSSNGGIVVNKHVYVHVAPPDAEEHSQPRQRVHVPAPQKHYKIIFIKAPTAPTPTVPDIPPIQQDEEKTLVYVLVKKPEEQPEIEIPTAAPTEPSKPEVYFIRYKAHKEEGAHGGIQGGAGQDISQIDASLDDTVEVGARQGGGGFQGGASQAGASAQAFGAGSRSSNGVSTRYGVSEARGPY